MHFTIKNIAAVDKFLFDKKVIYKNGIYLLLAKA